MRGAKRLLVNTAVLTAASVFMQTVDVFYHVYLTNRLGSAGIGLFSLITTVYGLSVTLGCGGIRLASTRLTVERAAAGESKRHVLCVCLGYALLTGGLMCALLYCGAGTVSRLWLSDLRCVRPLRRFALCLPFVAMSAALNGYFTAERKILRYAVVRVLEQSVKFITVAAVLTRWLGRGLEYGCLAVVTGTLASEVVSFILLFVLWGWEARRDSGRQAPIMRKLLRIALPDVTGAGLRSILLTTEHILIPIGFRRAGVSGEGALAVYGNIHGKVFPLLLYPSAVFSALAGLLVPELAEFHARRQTEKINDVIRRVLRMTVLYSVFTAGVLYAFAQGLSSVIYHNAESVRYMELLAPLVPVMYCDMTVDGMLKGLDQQFHSMLYNIFDSGLCVILVWFLLPRFAVKGYIFILFASEILNFYLSLRRLIKVSSVRIFPGKDLLLPLACTLCAVTAGKTLLRLLCPHAVTVVPLIAAIFCAALIYAIMLWTFGCLTAEDVQKVKGLVLSD